MTTANNYAAAAASVRSLAEEVRPAPLPPGTNLVAGAGDDYRQTRNLIVYHLRAAANKLQEIAEDKATKERTT